MVQILAGAAQKVITPDLSQGTTFLAGFQPNRPATTVHDDLCARALAIRTDAFPRDPAQPEYFILVVCDLIGLGQSYVQQIRKQAQELGIDTRGLVVSCTHTHSGPDTIGLWGRSPFQTGLSSSYQAFVQQQVAEAAVEAVQNLRPAQLRVGKAEMTSWLKNARQPHLLDRELSTLQAITDHDKQIFTLVNLPCHPEVMWHDNTAITADYAGAACREIERKQGGIGVFASADLGGMMTPDVDDRAHTFDTVELMGQDVAAAALSALEKGQNLDPASLQFHRYNVRIPLDNPLFKLARTIGTLPPLLLDDQGRILTQVSLLGLGMMQLTTIPGELLPRPGLCLRNMLHASYRFLIGLADDELGYLLPSDEFVYPLNPFDHGAHYEETMSVSRYATPLLMEAWAALLAGQPPQTFTGTGATTP